MTESPVVLAAPAPGTAYGVPFITISNIVATPSNNGFTVQFDTDVPCLMQMDWWSHNDPSITVSTAVAEGVVRSRHAIGTGAMPAGDHTGKYFGFSLRLDATDTTGLTLRSYQGFVRLIGARTVAKQNAVPVRFNTFSGPGDQAVPALGVRGNWSTYTWSQWNPKGN